MDQPKRFRAFLDELRRRRVYHVGFMYVVAGWITLQVADVVLPALGAPESVMGLLVILGATGLPVALALAWAYDVTPTGLKPDEGQSLKDLLGVDHRLRLLLASVVAVSSVGLGVLGWRTWVRPSTADIAVETPGSVDSAPPPDPARIAVLYLDDLSPDGSMGYLAAGLTGGLIDELGKVEAIDVVSRNGVKPYRDSAVSTDLLVEQLEAGSIVEGSVGLSGDSVRVTIQLIDGATDTHIESITFLRSREDLSSLETDLPKEVALLLRRRLGREIELQSIVRGASSQDAWTAVLRARSLMEDYDVLRMQDASAARRTLARADSILQQATRTDPTWPVPWIERARISHGQALLAATRAGEIDPEKAREAADFAREALRLDPESSEALRWLGRLGHALARGGGLDAEDQQEEAGRMLHASVDQDPSNAAAWIDLSDWLIYEGRFAEAYLAAERATDADAFLQLPLHLVWHQRYYASIQAGPSTDARMACDEGYRRFPTQGSFLTCQLFLLASFPQVAPDVDRAWALKDSLVAVTSAARRAELASYGTLFVAKVAARAGLPDSAVATLRLAVGPGQTPTVLTYDAAHFWVLMQEPDSAVRLLEKFLEEYPDTAFLAEDWWFDGLAGHPPFEALVGSYR